MDGDEEDLEEGDKADTQDVTRPERGTIALFVGLIEGDHEREARREEYDAYDTLNAIFLSIRYHVRSVCVPLQRR